MNQKGAPLLVHQLLRLLSSIASFEKASRRLRPRYPAERSYYESHFW